MAMIDKDLLLDKIDRLLKLHDYAREDWFANVIHNTVWDSPEIETDGETIYRADAIKAVKDAYVMDAIYEVISEDIIKALSALPSAEQVTGKLNNPCDSLLTDDSDECKEQKSKLDLISRTDAIEALRKAYFDKNIQSAKDDPCIVDAMTDWAIRQIKALPSAEVVSREDYHNLLTASEDIDRALREYQAKEEQLSAEVAPKIDHDREWIIGCIEHDGFIHTHRFDKANQFILDALSADAVQGWIPCSERLPSESGTYLTTTAKGSVCTDHYYANSNDICGRHWSYHRHREPIAWMPLPKPYKGGDDE